jgi:outer membrane biosynthesis protein TonB
MNGAEPSQPPQEPSSWGARLRRPSSRPPRRFVGISVALHLAVVGGLYAAGMHAVKLPEFEQFRVNLVSPPAQVEGPRQPVETTSPVVQPEPPKPEPKPDPPKPQPERTQAPQPKPPERKPEQKPATGPDPQPVAVGGENINVQRDGREFQYPEYLENIMLQMERHSRWTGPAGLAATVVFHINRDGSIGGLRLVERSGNFNYDAAAMQATEAAGRNKAFGPLPADWQRDRLWIEYTFENRR